MEHSSFYRKKPVVIEGIRYLGSNAEAVAKFVGTVKIFETMHEGFYPNPLGPFSKDGECLLWVAANQSWLPVQVGEWILKDASGYYPCQDERFIESYEHNPG